MNNEATTTTIKLKMLCITITDCTNWHDENKVTGFAYCFLFGPVFVSQRKIKLQKREKFKTLNFLDFFLFIYYFFFFFAEGHTHTPFTPRNQHKKYKYTNYTNQNCIIFALLQTS